MILKKCVIAVVFSVVWINGIFGASYSKVYVNSGSNGPYQYVGYGAPAAAYSAPIAQLSAAPVGSVVPYPQAATFVAPCVSPCVPQQPVAQVPNAGLIAYTAPKAVVVAKDVPTNYEYSYVVYDDGTGDQKAARELSDGGVVRGQYSFLQPDGYVRQVQYTADDVTGFNAVVNYLPGGDMKTVEVKAAKPCPDVKPEALKQADESKGQQPSNEESKPASDLPTSGEKTPKESVSEEKPSEISSVETSVPELTSEVQALVTPAPETPAPEASTAKCPTNKEEGSKEQSPAEKLVKVETPEGSKKFESSNEAISAEVKEDLSQVVENAIVQSVEAPQPAPVIVANTLPTGYISYEQLLKCIQKMKNADIRVNSPLTYILLPSNARPC